MYEGGQGVEEEERSSRRLRHERISGVRAG